MFLFFILKFFLSIFFLTLGILIFNNEVFFKAIEQFTEIPAETIIIAMYLVLFSQLLWELFWAFIFKYKSIKAIIVYNIFGIDTAFFTYSAIVIGDVTYIISLATLKFILIDNYYKVKE